MGNVLVDVMQQWFSEENKVLEETNKYYVNEMTKARNEIAHLNRRVRQLRMINDMCESRIATLEREEEWLRQFIADLINESNAPDVYQHLLREHDEGLFTDEDLEEDDEFLEQIRIFNEI